MRRWAMAGMVGGLVVAAAGAGGPGRAAAVPGPVAEPTTYAHCQSEPSYCADGEEPALPDQRPAASAPTQAPAVIAARQSTPRETTGPPRPARMRAIVYSVFPHPDDEGSDAVLLAGTQPRSGARLGPGPGAPDDIYPVYVVMTNGENSGACFSEPPADDADFDGDNDLAGIGPDSSSPSDVYPDPAGPYWYQGPSDSAGYPGAVEDSSSSTSYIQPDNGEYWPGSDGANTAIDAWTGKALAPAATGRYPATYPDDPAAFSSLGGCREGRLAALENMAEDLELHNGLGANFPDAGYDNYSPQQVCFSGVPTYWNGSSAAGSPKDPCAYAWIGAHGAILAFNLGDLNQNWDAGSYPTYENWSLSPEDVLWALRAVDANKATIGLPDLPDQAFVSDAWYNSTQPGGTTPEYGTEWGGTCEQYGHWNHYAVVGALYDNVVVAGVPNFGRTCSGDPAVGSTGMVLTPAAGSSLSALDASFYGPPTTVPYDTYSARQYGFEVGGYFGWDDALSSNCGTGSSIVEGEWSCDEAFWQSPAAAGR